MTAAQFKAKAERLFLSANPGATITGWTRPPRKVTFPTGVREFIGQFHAVADGHRPRVMVATGADDYVMVR